jgi:2-polyprenyl-3-methyl-5-hydroxy-6-metoxy-1,4-benzoquinol methylase
MDYREKLYSTYVSTHTAHLYGEATIEGIRRQFPVWKGYYGRFLPKDKKAKILDIGCGNGGFVYYLESLGYNNSAGIDISREQVELAKNLGIKGIECADVASFFNEKEETYDMVFARDVIEHFPKDRVLELLESAFKSLKRGGVIIILTPNGESPFASRYLYGDFTHEVAFTTNSLNQVLKTVGFREFSFYSTGPVPKGVKSVARFLIWKGIEAVLKFYMLVETGSSKGIFTQNIIATATK